MKKKYFSIQSDFILSAGKQKIRAVHRENCLRNGLSLGADSHS